MPQGMEVNIASSIVLIWYASRRQVHLQHIGKFISRWHLERSRLWQLARKVTPQHIRSIGPQWYRILSPVFAIGRLDGHG
jgi:hypothetical protein